VAFRPPLPSHAANATLSAIGMLEARGTSWQVTLKLIPRPDGAAAGQDPMTVQTDDPYFAIHHAMACEDLSQDGGAPTLRLYTAAWPRVGQGPFLGDWGGDVPLYDDGKINPTLLLQTTIELGSKDATVERVAVADGACIDHPHCDPRFDGDTRVRYVYMSFCNDEGMSGSPPVGYTRWDRQTGEKVVWRAPPRNFCEELVIIPRPRESASTRDEADVWLAGMVFDADAGRSSLVILDGDRIEAGPVCRLWLKDHVPHGLHGCFTPELFGPLRAAVG
jgi:all-trans-8'-apo-beta-carotenal 15,15'-oxygenase